MVIAIDDNEQTQSSVEIKSIRKIWLTSESQWLVNMAGYYNCGRDLSGYFVCSNGGRHRLHVWHDEGRQVETNVVAPTVSNFGCQDNYCVR